MKGSIEECRFTVDATKLEITSSCFMRRNIGKCNGLQFEDGIDMEGHTNKLVEVEYAFKQNSQVYSFIILKGSLRFAVSNFETLEQEAQVYSKIYQLHANMLVQTYDKVLILNLLNIDHAIENAEIESLEGTIRANPHKSVKYKYKNLVSVKSSIIDNSM